MGGRADLHIHTHFSDGVLSPREIIHRARACGLTALAFCDHDHTGAIAEGINAAAETGVEVIPGIELSAVLEGQEIHMLGYFIDPGHEMLQEFLLRVREERLRRASRMVEKLNGMNVPLPFDTVLDRAGQGSVGRPHIASALVEEGFASTYQEAFLRYLGTGRPAYEQKFPVAPAEIIRVIHAAGGLAFVAHPGSSLQENILLSLIREGIDGIEAVHPSHSHATEQHYRGIAEAYFLLTSGGSDFHGGKRNDQDALGKYVVSGDCVEAMRRRIT